MAAGKMPHLSGAYTVKILSWMLNQKLIYSWKFWTNIYILNYFFDELSAVVSDFLSQIFNRVHCTVLYNLIGGWGGGIQLDASAILYWPELDHKILWYLKGSCLKIWGSLRVAHTYATVNSVGRIESQFLNYFFTCCLGLVYGPGFDR